MPESATVAQFTPVQGMDLGISTATSTDLSDDTLMFADLGVTVKQPQYQGAATTKIDVTVIKSTAKEYALGLDDNGTFSMAGHWKVSDPAQQAMLTAKADKQPRVFKATFADQSAFKFVGLVDQYQWSANVDDTVSATFNVQVTGQVSVIQAPAPEGT